MTSTIQELEQQIIDLQTQSAFQEDMLHALNEVVSTQQQDILQLKAQLKKVLDELKTVIDDADYGDNSRLLENERPPHY